MNNELIKNLSAQEQTQNKQIEKQLTESENLINLSDGSKNLSVLQEVIVKTVYISRFAFLDDLVLLYSFPSCKQTIQKAVADLEKMGYLQTQATEYGKAIALTSKGIHQIRRKEDGFTASNADEFNNHLLKYKVCSGLLVQSVFLTLLKGVIKAFAKETKEERQRYVKMQFLKLYTYKEEIKASGKTYSSTEAEQFATDFYNSHEASYFDNSEAFQEFKAYLNQNCLKRLYDPLTSFHFLHDYYNKKGYGKEAVLYQAYNLYQEAPVNFLRQKEDTIRSLLLERENNSQTLKEERFLCRAARLKQLLEAKRRNLLKSNTGKSADLSELQTIQEEVEALEESIATLTDLINRYKDNFSFAQYAGTKESGLDVFGEQFITLDTLKQSGIFIQGVNSDKITFLIAPFEKGSFTYSSLFSKIERVYLFHHFCFSKLRLSITVGCYGEGATKDAEKMLAAVKEKFSEIKEYQLLATDFENVVHLTNSKFRFKERFEVFASVSQSQPEV